jgi:tetratricopeptide (TPR) repeat protein
MAAESRSLQDRIRDRQRSGFVGRQGQLIQYQENFSLTVDDEQRRFLFNIHGDAGVGKTFLTRQLRHIAAGAGALTAYADETAEDVSSAMTAIAEQFSRAGSKLGDFEKRAAEYRQRRHELESDPHAPAGVAAFLTKTAVTIGLAAARDIPFAGSVLAPVDAAAAADQANQAREYLAKKFSDHRDVRLLLSPADELTPVFVAGLNRAAAGRTVALFFDTYERTAPFLDQWLRSLYAGSYGDLPETLVTTISGQKPLDPNLWGEYLPVIADIPLEPFSEAEARQFLASKGITDEPTVHVILTLSGRLPLWLATLADARSQGSADIGDPSGNAVERFLKWEDDPARRVTAMAAALPRVLNQDVIAVITSPDQARELFGWLRELPFVSQRGESWAYHDVVRAAMLRLRRAQAPAEWRSEHDLLAQANARWASEAIKGTGSAWTTADWIDYTREETYHLLCADPYGNLPKALGSAVEAAAHSPARARQWATLIADAGRDTRDEQLQNWGQRLTEGARSDDLSSYLTWLINGAHLDRTMLPIAYKQRGVTYREMERYDDALGDFNRAIELDPSDSLVIALRGMTYRAMKRYDDALGDFNRAIELDPSDSWAIAHRGEAYLAMERYDDALGDFNRAIELDPSDSGAIALRGLTYRAMERYDDALGDLNRAIELDPSKSWAIAQRGEAYRAMKRYDDALGDLNRAIELDPSDDDYFARRAEIRQLMGEGGVILSEPSGVEPP